MALVGVPSFSSYNWMRSSWMSTCSRAPRRAPRVQRNVGPRIRPTIPMAPEANSPVDATSVFCLFVCLYSTGTVPLKRHRKHTQVLRGVCPGGPGLHARSRSCIQGPQGEGVSLMASFCRVAQLVMLVLAFLGPLSKQRTARGYGAQSADVVPAPESCQHPMTTCKKAGKPRLAEIAYGSAPARALNLRTTIVIEFARDSTTL